MTQTGAADDAETIAALPPRRESAASLLVRLSILLSLGVVVCSAAGFLGRTYWALELFSHFRLQYTLALFVLLLAPLVTRRWRAFAFVAVLFSIHVVSLVTMWVGKPAVGVAGIEVRVAMWNVNTANRRHEEVISFLREADADIILMLEIDDRWLRELHRGLPAYSHTTAAPRDDNFGIGLFSKLPFSGDTEPMGSASLPVVHATFQVGEVVFELVGVHTLPPKNARYAAHRNEMFDKLAEIVPQIDRSLFLLGDLNVTPWSPYFSDLLEGTGLIDGRRGFGLRPTWPSSLGTLGIPIDHCLVSPGVAVRSFEVGPGGGSDHRAVVVDLAIPSRGSLPMHAR